MKQAFTAPTGATVDVAHAAKKTDVIEKKLHEMLIQLPLMPKSQGSYLQSTRVASLVYLSGQLPLKDNSLGPYRGRLGKEITVDSGQRAAKQCTLNALAILKRDLGSLEKIKRVVRLTGYVAGMPGFHEQAVVLNAASDFLIELFGEAGRHVRSAVGVTDLPLGSCIEIEFIFEVK